MGFVFGGVAEVVFGELHAALSLWDRLRKFWEVRRRPTTQTVGSRFIQLFEAHGVHRNQISRLLASELKLGDLQDDARLLNAISDADLDAACTLFGVRREWLEGASERMYESLWCYKSPENLFEELEKMESPASIAPLRAITTAKVLDRQGFIGQRLELVLVETAALLGEQEVSRFRVFSDGFDWAYEGCRVQVKAMIRAYGRPVPLYIADARQIDELYAGHVVPAGLMRGGLCTSPSLEDYCMRGDENFHATEIEELESVYEYMQANNLGTRWGSKRMSLDGGNSRKTG